MTFLKWIQVQRVTTLAGVFTILISLLASADTCSVDTCGQNFNCGPPSTWNCPAGQLAAPNDFGFICGNGAGYPECDGYRQCNCVPR